MIPTATYANPANFGECSTDTNPTVLFNECAENVVENLSEIVGVLISMPTEADPTVPEFVPVDVTDLAAWEAAITAGTVNHEFVIGDKPATEQEERPISRGRTKVGDKKHLINIDVDENTDENYDAMRQRQDRPIVFIWYYTLGGKIYGSTTGIKSKITKADEVLGRGADTYALIQYAIEWEAATNPPRDDSPFTI